ncbi:hypothetical protein CALVIDRAFT_565661 [Calocera viscosa TUFC12733]|uniref:Uncharacterized protein n=1 Tax=Calocera viscosa (strain TUFC12733) TaxID=1330018 RepID=A0A167K5W7_CALVF|nr:hypothetical protein CALVIDRAFT_565661 [Calocera viscosa TUFC12733]
MADKENQALETGNDVFGSKVPDMWGKPQEPLKIDRVEAKEVLKETNRANEDGDEMWDQLEDDIKRLLGESIVFNEMSENPVNMKVPSGEVGTSHEWSNGLQRPRAAFDCRQHRTTYSPTHPLPVRFDTILATFIMGLSALPNDSSEQEERFAQKRAHGLSGMYRVYSPLPVYPAQPPHIPSQRPASTPPLACAPPPPPARPPPPSWPPPPTRPYPTPPAPTRRPPGPGPGWEYPGRRPGGPFN